MSKRRVSEPGYRYAKERERYMKLGAEGRRLVKEQLEKVWQDNGVQDGRYKGRWPCPRLEDKR